MTYCNILSMVGIIQLMLFSFIMTNLSKLEPHFNPPTFGTFFIQVDVPFETIRYCGFEW